MDQYGNPVIRDCRRLVTPEGQLRAVAGLKPLKLREVAAIDRTRACYDRLQFRRGTNRGGHQAGHDERGGAECGEQHYDDAQQPPAECAWHESLPSIIRSPILCHAEVSVKSSRKIDRCG